ncbi:unnamed protein product [Blepharisma stoltei]|uniref:glutathione transferase n=1 Tax=Blepharisma stoltei TaxID=1481888 RepID=A0AAU9ISI1_9CILI|nr:unnamed protein product [Blepharisma stoltei]
MALALVVINKMQKPTIAYWGVRSLAEPIRMLLHHLEVDFEDKYYVFGEEEWPQDKERLGLDFPNLPYYIDDQVKLTESYAIFLYIALKYNPNYLGRTTIEQAHVNMVYGVLKDIFMPFALAGYEPDASTRMPMTLDSKRAALEKVSSYLEGKRFFNGDQPTYVDFYAHELIERIEAYSPDYLAAISPNFAAFKTHFRELAHMDEFLSRLRLKFNLSRAHWGN